MADPTTNYSVNLPDVNADDDTWGTINNDAHQSWDTLIATMLPKAGGTMTGALVGTTPAAGGSGYASSRLPHGAAPTTNLTNGDLWTTTAGLYVRINGATVGPLAAAGGAVSVNNDNWSGTDLAVVNGGTGASTAADARTNLSAAKSGANSDITSLSALSTPLSIAQGGTGATSASGVRSAIGLVIGTDVQAYDADLTSVANNRILGNVSGSTSTPAQLTASQVAAMIAGSLDMSDMTIGDGAPASFWIKLGPFYVQWGSVSVTPAQSGTSGQGSVTFPQQFPTACSGVIPYLYRSGGGLGSGVNLTPYVDSDSISTSGCALGLDQDSAGSPGAQTVGYFAWGY